MMSFLSVSESYQFFASKMAIPFFLVGEGLMNE